MADSTITIRGALGKDPDLRFTAGGRAVCSLTVATSNRYKPANSDEWVDKTAWIDVTVWGDMAENISASCSKGTRVICTGHMEQDEYETKEGEKRQKLKMVADEVGVSLRWARAEVERIEREK